MTDKNEQGWLNQIPRRLALPTIAMALCIGCGAGDLGAPTEQGEPVATLSDALVCGPTVVPVLTASSASVIASGSLGTGYESWRAFDADDYSMWISAIGQTPAIIGYNFGSLQRVTSYRIRFSNGSLTSRAPKDFSLQGYNGNSWVVVDTRTNQTGWGGNEDRTFTVASPGSYSQYRLSVTDDNDSASGISVVSIGKLQLSTCDCGSQAPVMTSNSSPSGAVSSSGYYGSGNEPWRAFDGTSSSMWLSSTWTTPAWLAYDFGVGKTITRYAITFSNGSSLTSRAPKDFTFEGWNGSSWVVLDRRTNQISWAGTERREYRVTSPGAYGNYRLNISDDNDSRTGVVVASIGSLELLTDSCDVALDWNNLINEWKRDRLLSTADYDYYVPSTQTVPNDHFIKRLKFSSNGAFQKAVTSPNDGLLWAYGTWTRSGNTISTVVFDPNAQHNVSDTFDVLSLTQNVLETTP